jgi:4-hydroxybenzoate polyprenyltransferase
MTTPPNPQASSSAPRYQVQQTPAGPVVVRLPDIGAVPASAVQPVSASQRLAVPAWRAWIALLRLDRPVGIYLLLWPTICALLLANSGAPSGKLILIFSLGTVLMRSAGCVVNDYADQWLDGSVERTANRPLVSGSLSQRTAIMTFVALMLLALALVSFTNQSTMIYAAVAAGIAVAYPFCKRYTYMPQAVLGLAFSMGIPMAYTASGQSPDASCWLLFCANWIWTLAYDTLYAMVDRDDDEQAGAKSTAILFGDLDLIAVSMMFVMMLLSLVAMGRASVLNQYFYIGLGVIALQFAGQIFYARSREPARCFGAFLANQWVGLTLFASMLVGLHNFFE